MQKIKISVVIAAFNEEESIAKCIKAVRNQTFPKEKYEILVVDNNSTDKTAEIIKKLGATFIFYDLKQGAAAAKHFGVQEAKGEIIAITDADSIPDANWLETINRLMQNKSLMCIGGTILSTEDAFVNFLYIILDFIARVNQLFGISLIGGPNMAVRKNAFMEIGGFDMSLKTSDDWEFVLRIQKRFGIRSTLYTSALCAKTSPRKQKKIGPAISYIFICILNYISIFILRKSKTYGNLVNVR